MEKLKALLQAVVDFLDGKKFNLAAAVAVALLVAKASGWIKLPEEFNEALLIAAIAAFHSAAAPAVSAYVERTRVDTIIARSIANKQ